MDLSILGYDDWFERRAAGILQPAHSIARVTAVDRGAFLVRDQNDEFRAELAGKFRYGIETGSDLPCVGDWACVQRQPEGSPSIIHDVLPRKTFLRRRAPGKPAEFQMIAANIDVAFIVQSCQYDFNIPRLSRYLVMANDGHIEPKIILSKTDLISKEELEQLIEGIRSADTFVPILPLSNASGFGLEDFRTLIEPGRTYCFIGSSGVGKTTLINRLIGREDFETKGVSGTGEGVHTTSRRHLILLDSGAMLIDNPGMRELGLLGNGEGMDATFGDIGDYKMNCRFPDCTHTHEPGCAVLTALENGELDNDRYQNYIKLRKEAEYHGLSHLEKRRKDRAFGRFVKSAKKQMKE